MSNTSNQHAGMSEDEPSIEGNETGRIQMDKLIMNYLVTEGFKDVAEKFQQESGVDPSVDLQSLKDRSSIRDAIISGKIEEAVTLIRQIHPELLHDKNLHFYLMQQHLIGLIANDKVEEAIAFAQSFVSQAGEVNSSILQELERTLALLAFDNPSKSPFGNLLTRSYTEKIASDVNAAILKKEDQEAKPSKLSTLLKLIHWAQEKLDKNNVKYPKMTDLETATIEKPK